MNKIFGLGAFAFVLFSLASVTMPSPAVMAWESTHRSSAVHAGVTANDVGRSRVIEVPTQNIVGRVSLVHVLPTVFIYGRVPAHTTVRTHEEYTIGTTHVIADSEMTTYASR